MSVPALSVPAFTRVTPHDPNPPSHPPAFSRRWLTSYAALAVLAVGAGLFVRVNTTPSLPRGIYLRLPLGSRPVAPGDDVFVCMPAGAAARLAVERGYVSASTRDCASGAVPLLKHVLAAEGDTVRLDSSGVFVRGRRIGPPPREQDRAGRPLRPVYGRWALSPGALWLGSDIVNGYDSRYLGPVPTRLVLGRAVRLVRF